MTENKKCVLIILSVVIIWNPSVLVQANDIEYETLDTNEIPNVLSMLASVTQANYEKIKTWECRVTENSMITIKGKIAAELLSKHTNAEPNDSIDEIKRFSVKKIDFKIDMGKNWLYSNSDSNEPYIYLDPDKGKRHLSNRGPEEMIYISKPEYQMEILTYSKTKGGIILNKLARKERAGKFRITDPREAFSIGEKKLWFTLSQLSQALQIPDSKKFGVVVKKKSVDDNITYRIEISMPGENWPFMVLVMSSETGFNLTYMENQYDEASLRSKTTIEFVNLKGVFLPSKWKISQYSPKGGLIKEKILTVEHQNINNTISEITFSERSYLNDGDKYRDEITKKKYIYQNEQFIEVE